MKKVIMTLAIAGMLFGAVSCGNNKKAAEEETKTECKCENCENCTKAEEKATIESAAEKAAIDVIGAAAEKAASEIAK